MLLPYAIRPLVLRRVSRIQIIGAVARTVLSGTN
jgi:hypothetical protein